MEWFIYVYRSVPTESLPPNSLLDLFQIVPNIFPRRLCERDIYYIWPRPLFPRCLTAGSCSRCTIHSYLCLLPNKLFDWETNIRFLITTNKVLSNFWGVGGGFFSRTEIKYLFSIHQFWIFQLIHFSHWLLFLCFWSFKSKIQKQWSGWFCPLQQKLVLLPSAVTQGFSLILVWYFRDQRDNMDETLIKIKYEHYVSIRSSFSIFPLLLVSRPTFFKAFPYALQN